MARGFYKKYLVVVVIVAGIIFLNNYLLGNFLQGAFYKIIIKPEIFVNRNLHVFSKFSLGFLKTQELVDQNAKIKEENNILRGELAQLENLKRENQFLRNELGLAKRLNSQLMIVQIFNIQRGALTSTALINKGLLDGINKSMPLIATGNILVGVIDRVFNDSASVLLIDDPRVKVNGRIQESHILVNTKGGLQNQLSLDLVATGDEINEGDTVVTSGLDGLPESLLVAKITGVKTPSGALFKTVTAQPFFDPSLSSSLFVILK